MLGEKEALYKDQGVGDSFSLIQIKEWEFRP